MNVQAADTELENIGRLEKGQQRIAELHSLQRAVDGLMLASATSSQNEEDVLWQRSFLFAF